MVSISKVKKNLATKVMLNRLFNQNVGEGGSAQTTGFIYRVDTGELTSNDFPESSAGIQRIASPFIGLH